jgi:hypothetical protein
LPMQAQQVEYCRPMSLLHVKLVQKLQKCLNFTNIARLIFKFYDRVLTVFLITVEILFKIEIQKRSDFWRFFSCQKWGKKKLEGKNHQIHMFGFH